MTTKEHAIIANYNGQEYTIYQEQYCDVPWHGKDWQILIQYENSSYTSGPYETIEEAMANARADIDQHKIPEWTIYYTDTSKTITILPNPKTGKVELDAEEAMKFHNAFQNAYHKLQWGSAK